jgi:hypothetical protein
MYNKAATALPLSGGTITGNIKVDAIDNEPSNTNHRFVFGASGRDKVEIYEYGGELNLYKSVNGVNTKILGVSPSSFTYNGNNVLTKANFSLSGTTLTIST